MTGKELFKKYTDRDFSGSEADVYAQTLLTIFAHVHDDIFPLLEKAEKENKKLDIKSFPENEQMLHDELVKEDIIFV